MIEILREQFNDQMPYEEKINRIREFLQIILLKIIHEKALFNNMAFVGGTALRVLYGLRRFSEDLDFSLIDKKGYDFHKINSEITASLQLYGLQPETKVKAAGNVHSSLIKFKGLLKMLELSQLEGQNLSVKIEIDSNPPKGWSIENTIINKTYMFNITHFDLPSLYATKLHACFYRKFTKGRDIYDLIWYLTKKIKPNYLLLNNAIKQTEGHSVSINDNNFKDFLLEQSGKIDFKKAKKDVDRFLEDKIELKFFTMETIKSSIESAYQGKK